MKKILISFIWGFLCLFGSSLYAQRTSIQIRDLTTNKPIDGVNYKYGALQGISDLQGRISFALSEKDSLFLFHVSYGEWFLPPSALRDAIRKGIVYKKQKVFEVQPVTVIAMRYKPGDMEHVRMQIGDRLTHDAGTILTRNPVISGIRKSGGYGLDPVMRGFKYDQLNIVIDGAQSAASACPNRMDPPTSQVAPNMMDHVEIFKGPHSFRFGNSFGGTINFKSNTLLFTKRRQYYGRFSGSTESNGGIYRSEGVAGVRGELYNVGVFGSFSKGHNYKDGVGISVPAGFQRLSIGFKAGLALTNKQKMIVSLTRNVADKTDFPALPMDLISDKTNLINLSHKYHIAGKYLKSWNSSAFYSAVNHIMNNHYKSLTPRKLNAETKAHTLSYGGRSEGTWVFPGGRLYGGVDFRVEQADGQRERSFLMGPMAGKTFYDNVWNGGMISRVGIFSEYNHLFSSFKMIVSGRLEYNRARATDPDKGFFSKNRQAVRAQLNPGISIGGIRHLRNGFEYGVWLGRSQRSASLTERYINSFSVGVDPYDMLGNPSLKPEVNNQLDISLRYQGRAASIDVNLFGSLLRDFISSEIDPSLTPTMPSSPGVRRFKNIGKAMMTGFEMTWNQRWPGAWQQQIALAYTFGRDLVHKGPLPEIAPLDLRIHIVRGFLNNKLTPGITFRYVLAQNRIARNFGETKTPGFNLLDLDVNYRVFKNSTLTFGVKNVFDMLYYEHLTRSVRGTDYAIHAPGRNIFLSVSVDMM